MTAAATIGASHDPVSCSNTPTMIGANRPAALPAQFWMALTWAPCWVGATSAFAAQTTLLVIRIPKTATERQATVAVTDTMNSDSNDAVLRIMPRPKKAFLAR